MKKHFNNTLLILNVKLCLALLVIAALAAFPSNNYQPLGSVSTQRNNLDSALKQILSGRPVQLSASQATAYIPNNIPNNVIISTTSLDNNPANKDIATGLNFQNSKIFQGTTANFPYVYPVMGPRKSSGYGLRIHPIRKFSTKHTGIDLAAPIGASIRSMAKGNVIFADPYAGYGNLVVIDHGYGVTTHYAHCAKLKVHTGEKVDTGQVIAEVGSTGQSTGPHLHLEIRIKGEPLNPETFFVGLADKAEG